MHNFSKYVRASVLLVALALLATGYALENKVEMPYRVIQQVAAYFRTNNSTPDQAQSKPEQALANRRDLNDSALPSTLTYYRWTDSEGNNGYSKELPANVSSFKAIVLDSQNTSL